MRSKAVQLVFAVVALFTGAAAEELLPKALGVGFPVLLAFSLFANVRGPSAKAVLFAVAAGAMEDAICSLPWATSIGFFSALALASRWSKAPTAFVPIAFPCFQLWLWLWRPDLNGSVFSRFLVAIPVGLATAAAAFPLLRWAERTVAIDEE